jgi:hypothetical protein
MTDYAALEVRVAALEQQVRQSAADKLDALNFGISALHGELRVFRQETKEQLDGIDRKLDQNGALMDQNGKLMEEILRRLPPRC